MTNVGNVGPKALVVSNGRGHARDATMRSFAPRPRTKPAGAQVRVLIVDDEREIHEDFESILGPPVGSESDDLAAAFGEEARVEWNPDFDLQHAMSGEEAYELIAAGRRRNEPIAVAYVDVRMPPGIDGLETVRKIREIDRDVEIVIMTAYADKPLPEIVHDMDLLHKLLYVRKPFTRQEVQQITLALTAKWTVERDLVRQPAAACGGARRYRRGDRGVWDTATVVVRQSRVRGNHGRRSVRAAGDVAGSAGDALRGALPAAGCERRGGEPPPCSWMVPGTW